MEYPATVGLAFDLIESGAPKPTYKMIPPTQTSVVSSSFTLLAFFAFGLDGVTSPPSSSSSSPSLAALRLRPFGLSFGSLLALLALVAFSLVLDDSPLVYSRNKVSNHQYTSPASRSSQQNYSKPTTQARKLHLPPPHLQSYIAKTTSK